MLNATINAKILKRLVNVMKNITDEAVFRIDKNEIGITVIDPANTYLADIRAPSEQFEIYEATEHQIGVDIDNLWSKIKTVKANATIHLSEEIKDNEPIRLLLKIGNSTFGIKLLDINQLRRVSPVPTVQLSAITKDQLGSDIKQLVKDAKAVADEIVFTVDGVYHDTFRAVATGDDTYKLELPNSSVGDGKSKYMTEYLSFITTTIDDKDIVNLSFGTDTPLKIDFTIDQCEIVEWLAARVEQQDK